MDIISAGKLRRYQIMRLLFVSDKTFNDLADNLSFPAKQLVRELERLYTAHCIKKAKEEPTETEITEVTIAADLLGVRPKKKAHVKYTLTKSGKLKLAYWDYTFELHKYVSLPSLIDQDEKYFEMINEIAERKNFFK